jgi:hypothetical protein
VRYRAGYPRIFRSIVVLLTGLPDRFSCLSVNAVWQGSRCNPGPSLQMLAGSTEAAGDVALGQAMRRIGEYVVGIAHLDQFAEVEVGGT